MQYLVLCFLFISNYPTKSISDSKDLLNYLVGLRPSKLSYLYKVS